jgi:hypothetical protein
MSTISPTALCIVADAACARLVADDLRASGFGLQHISLVIPNRLNARQVTNGWFSGMELLAIPGTGAYLASGPLHDDLIALGPLPAHAVSRSLFAMGVSDFESTHFETRLRSGMAVIAVHVANTAEATQALAVFERHGAESSLVTDGTNTGTKT